MLGFVLGIIIGLLPGMHINTFAPFLSSNTIFAGIIIFTAAVVANFFEFFKSSILFSPGQGDILLTNPLKRMIMQGRIIYGLKLFSLGAVLGCIFSCLISPILFWILPLLDRYIAPVSGWLVMIIMTHIIIKDKSPRNALLLFLFSGILGSVVFLSNIENPLMPMLTGFFGISTLISLKGDIPKQMEKVAFVAEKKEVIKGSLIGFASSLLLGLVPAIGPSQASMVGIEFDKRRREEVFITSIASINTSDVFISLITYMIMGKARIGAFKYFPNNLLFLVPLLIIGLLSSLLAFAFMFYLGPKLIKKMIEFDFQVMKKMLLFFISLVSFLLAGMPGLIVMTLSTLIGYYFEEKTIKSHAMGCLIIPLLLGFL